jgi:hypothetical protein
MEVDNIIYRAWESNKIKKINILSDHTLYEYFGNYEGLYNNLFLTFYDRYTEIKY